MSLSVTWLDSGDGTGGVATVAGTAGAAASVWSMPMADGEVFSQAGSRVGDGPVTLALAPRLYWLYAASAGSVSTVVGVHVTDGNAKAPTRCRAAVAARIRALGLTTPGGATMPVIEQMYPDEATISTYPCVVLSVDGATETDGPNGTWAADDRGFPVKVQICDRNGVPPDHRMLPTYESWRYAIERAFAGQYLPGVPESGSCTIEPYLIADPAMPQYQFFVSGMLVRCFCRVPRGLGV